MSISMNVTTVFDMEFQCIHFKYIGIFQWIEIAIEHKKALLALRNSIEFMGRVIFR